MVHGKICLCGITILAALALLAAVDCRAQERLEDHSCTVDAAGAVAFPQGADGQNFNTGWGFQVGGGFAVSRSTESGYGNNYYVTANYLYDKFGATGAALGLAKTANPTELANATSAHGAFSAITLDPVVRHAFSRRLSVYGSGGFGWLRRAVSFNGANPGTLLQPNGPSLDRLSSNSGVFDLGAGANFGLKKKGGFMLFAEARVYRGLAINGSTTLVPVSVGIRW